MVANERKANDTNGLKYARTNNCEPFRWVSFQFW